MKLNTIGQDQSTTYVCLRWTGVLRIFFGENTRGLELPKPRSLALLPGVIEPLFSFPSHMFCLDGIELLVED
jgi:hypothetical protein